MGQPYEKTINLRRKKVDGNYIMQIVNEMFPIIYNGKEYYEEDCDDVFLSFYSCPQALVADCGVYVSSGMYVHPDGEMFDF